MTGRRHQAGSSTLEILIAVAVLLSGITAAVLVSFGNQSSAGDAADARQALTQAAGILENTRASAGQNYNDIVGTALPPVGTYQRSAAVVDHSPCLKEVQGRVSWTGEAARSRVVSLATFIADVPGSLAVGGDCDGEPPASDWQNPQTFATDTMASGKPMSLDVLNSLAYVGGDQPPYLFIANTRTAVAGQTGGLFMSFGNGFSAAGPLNAIDVAHGSNGREYAYVASGTTTGQLQIIDVTDPSNPMTVASRTVAGVNPLGSYPQGNRVTYYGDRVYLTTKETAGPEFHVFDVHDTTNPVELGAGLNLNHTVNSLVVREQVFNGVTRRLAYLATTANAKELLVLDVIDPAHPVEMAGASRDLPGDHDALSVYLIGQRLYVGREFGSSSDPDLFVLDASNPFSATAGLPIIGQQDIGAGVSGIRVSGRFAYLATTKSGREVQVWDVADPAVASRLSTYHEPSLASGAMDDEHGRVYVAGPGSAGFRMVVNP